jgi:PAS domain-containing protein
MSKHSFVPVTEISTPVDRQESGLGFNENNLIQVLELSSDIVCVCKAGAITSVNSHGVSLLGAKNEAGLIGSPFFDFMANEYSSAIDDFIAVLAEETEPFPAKLVALNEKEIGVKISLYVARELGDDTATILPRDVTNQVRMSEAIQRSEAKYRKLINNALHLICT